MVLEEEVGQQTGGEKLPNDRLLSATEAQDFIVNDPKLYGGVKDAARAKAEEDCARVFAAFECAGGGIDAQKREKLIAQKEAYWRREYMRLAVERLMQINAEDYYKNQRWIQPASSIKCQP